MKELKSRILARVNDTVIVEHKSCFKCALTPSNHRKQTCLGSNGIIGGRGENTFDLILWVRYLFSKLKITLPCYMAHDWCLVFKSIVK